MIRGIVLDVDDTLYLERDYVLSGFRVVGDWCRSELAVEGVADRAWKLFQQGRRRTTLTDALTDSGIDVDAKMRNCIIDIYRAHSPDIRLLADASSFIERHAASVRLGVITDGPAQSQRAKCHALGLYSATAPVVITDELGTSKPDLAVYRFVEDQWRLSGADLVYVADNPGKDFIGPLQLGWQCLRVRRKESLHVDVPTPFGVTEVEDLWGAALGSF